jgi:hypothetical protein
LVDGFKAALKKARQEAPECGHNASFSSPSEHNSAVRLICDDEQACMEKEFFHAWNETTA